MNKKILIILIVFVVLLLIIWVSIEYRLDRIEVAITDSNNNKNPDIPIFNQNNFNTKNITKINIDKFIGNGNAFGDNNLIKNKAG
jgi:hypothetical protein